MQVSEMRIDWTQVVLFLLFYTGLLIFTLSWIIIKIKSHGKMHEKHFEHSGKVEIHRESMDSEHIKALFTDFSHQIETLTAATQDVRKSVHDLRDALMKVVVGR